jgi:hypothetical protein
MYPFILLRLTFLLILAPSIVSAQQTPSNVGVLTCSLVPDETKARPLSCGFKPTSSGAEGRYVGAIREGGASLQGKQILVWTVMASGGMKIDPAALGQRFSSQPGDPDKLVGKTNSAITLQPETTPGGNKRDAIKEIELNLTSNPV